MPSAESMDLYDLGQPLLTTGRTPAATLMTSFRKPVGKSVRLRLRNQFCFSILLTLVY
jgi:hypothetical protein